MALYKKDVMLVAVFVGFIIALMLGIFYVSSPPVKHDWGACVNKVAEEAYVEDDVEDTFDAGFDAGLLAAKLCK